MLKNSNSNGMAHLRYDNGEYHILVHGTYVLCAVTGQKISLENLAYWSVKRQEAYIDVHASMQAEQGQE